MSVQTARPKLGERFDDALVLAATLHRTQVRKGTDVPYVSHLLAVAALVLEDGGDEDLAIAALLHDAVEDQGGGATHTLIEQRFGARVTAIVEALTEAEERSGDPWLARKRHQLERLATAPPDALRVKAADTLHNVQTVLSDWERIGPAVWDRFDPDSCPVNQVWHHAEVARIVSSLGDASTLPARLRSAIQRLRDEARPACDRDHEHPGIP